MMLLFLQAPFCLPKNKPHIHSISFITVAPSYITYTDLPISTFGYSTSCWNILFVKTNSDLKQ